jgi:ADP-ribose pyrophosphatase
MSLKVDIIETKVCYDGFFKLLRYKLKHSLFAGGWSEELLREIIERGQAVAVLPYDPITDQVIMIEQFRPGALNHPDGAWLWEIVAGIIESGETAPEVAHREAIEETGCQVSDILRICEFFVSPGCCTETTTLFCGRVDANKVKEGSISGVASEHEDIQVHVISLTDALNMLETGKIKFAPAVIALQWLALHREDVKAKWKIN